MSDKGLYCHPGGGFMMRQEPLTDLEPACKVKNLRFCDALPYMLSGKYILRASEQVECYGFLLGKIMSLQRVTDDALVIAGEATFEGGAILAQDWMVMP